jgi:hypothetical protein
MLLACDDSEMVIIDRAMDNAFLGAHRAVADDYFVNRAGDLERHLPAVTTALISSHSCSLRILLKEPPENTPRCQAAQLDNEATKKSPAFAGLFF